jgi:hypothetical protein
MMSRCRGPPRPPLARLLIARQHTILVAENPSAPDLPALWGRLTATVADASRLSGVVRAQGKDAGVDRPRLLLPPGVKSRLMRYMRTALGLLNATRTFSDGMSVLMIGARQLYGAPWRRSPSRGSMLKR